MKYERSETRGNVRTYLKTSLFKRDSNSLHCKVNVSSRYQKTVQRGSGGEDGVEQCLSVVCI